MFFPSERISIIYYYIEGHSAQKGSILFCDFTFSLVDTHQIFTLPNAIIVELLLLCPLVLQYTIYRSVVFGTDRVSNRIQH